MKTRHISIISKRHIGHMQSRELYQARNQTSEGHIAQNEMDTHADTCCAGANWSPMELTGEICDVKSILGHLPTYYGNPRCTMLHGVD
jgi:hypothetical protein